MINLIPPAAKKKVVKEYWLRVFTIWLFLIGSAFFVVGILNFPAYVLTLSQASIYSEQVENAADELESSEASELLIKDANERAVHLVSKEDGVDFSLLMEQLESLAGAGITITQFNFERKDNKLGPIKISGIAASRADLTSFDDSIEAHASFSEAELPISNLAKDSNINYQITVTPVSE